MTSSDMNRKSLEAVVASNKPFTIRTADGTRYRVPHRDNISLPPTSAGLAVVYEDDGTMHLLSLLTVTNVTLNNPAKASGKRKSGKSG
jgi:hypothetical protein